jgi:hypothetical protein
LFRVLQCGIVTQPSRRCQVSLPAGVVPTLARKALDAESFRRQVFPARRAPDGCQRLLQATLTRELSRTGATQGWNDCSFSRLDRQPVTESARPPQNDRRPVPSFSDASNSQKRLESKNPRLAGFLPR